MLKLLFACATALALCACAASTAVPPAEPVAIDPAAAGWNVAALDELVRYAASQKSTGLIIVHDNRLIVEKHWPVLQADAQAFRASFVHGVAADGALLEDVASQQKSFVAILAGVAIDQGLLDISRPVSSYIGGGWSKATPPQEAAITVRHLLEMNSGLTEALTVDEPPDTKFFYNTPAYAVLKPVLEAATRQPLEAITQRWLAGPAGMRDTAWRERPPRLADSGNPTGLVTTPRDVARMGQMVLNGGVTSDGVRVISRQQLAALFVPTRTNPSYGRLWWINGGAETVGAGPGSPRRAGQYIGAAPADMVGAMGALDRKLFIVPSRRLIVVRTGQAAPDRNVNDRLWRLLAMAMPPA